jgi:hypothetical protein
MRDDPIGGRIRVIVGDVPPHGESVGFRYKMAKLDCISLDNLQASGVG